MQNKGLCISCGNDNSCIFQVSFPVLQCEEFYNSNHLAVDKARQPKQRSKGLEEITLEE